ncbi:MAG: family 10 glycosylhydrolase [Lentisphaerae bacterium]|nr:family 10 glycosylhydrolase [Lentisphaerota bacterium]
MKTNGWQRQGAPVGWAWAALALLSGCLDIQAAGMDMIKAKSVNDASRAINAETSGGDIEARSGAIAVVKGTASVADPGERAVSLDAARRVSRLLAKAGVPHAVLDDDDVMAGKLKTFCSAVLPYNPLPPRREIAAFASFLQRGGKLIVFYAAAPPLADLMGMKLGSYQASPKPGHWSLFRFNRKAPPHFPTEIFQESFNIFPVYPKDNHARVIAYWHNAAGDVQPDPAWVQSDSGFWMTHILLNGDDDNKALMLLAMLGSLDPSIWKDAAQKAREQTGRLAGFMNLSQTTNALAQQALGSPRQKTVQNLLAEAAKQHDRLVSDWEQGQYPDVVAGDQALRQTLVQAYAQLQTPRLPEGRGIWDHSGMGLYPGDWDKTGRLLEEAGLNLLFVNLLWAGIGHYPSRVISASDVVSRYGDQAKACTAAARRFHLEIHAWKVCWNLAQAPKSLLDELKQAGRLQQAVDGSVLPWLCPTHPDNVALELDAITEIAGNYPLNGIHLDYIRYPDALACFCSGCRRRFEKDLGQKVNRWPEDIQSGALAGRWLAWRSDSITAFVRAVREALPKINPNLKLSAAVYPNYPECVASIGQDWGRWLKEGLVDFVCPMDYMPNGVSFQDMVQRQLALPAALERVYPGIGVSAMDNVLGPDQVIDQIVRARAAGARGFVLFDLNRPLARDVLPLLKMGVTRKEESAPRPPPGGLSRTSP